MSEATESPQEVRAKQNAATFRVRQLLAQARGQAGWDAAWQEGATPWDAGASQPPLRQLFETSLATDIGIAQSGRALVPGCGRGYDAIYLASRGYDVLGVDLSTTAINEAKTFLGSQSQIADSLKVDYRVLDFFQSPALADQSFDIAYDYTFFCAIPPELRESWGHRMAALVKPGGHLITLVYPIDIGRARDDGPPFPVDVEAYVQALQQPWDKVLDIVPDVSQPTHVGRERLVVWYRQAV